MILKLGKFGTQLSRQTLMLLLQPTCHLTPLTIRSLLSNKLAHALEGLEPIFASRNEQFGSERGCHPYLARSAKLKALKS